MKTPVIIVCTAIIILISSSASASVSRHFPYECMPVFAGDIHVYHYGVGGPESSARLFCPIPMQEKNGYTSDKIEKIVVYGKDIRSAWVCFRYPFLMDVSCGEILGPKTGTPGGSKGVDFNWVEVYPPLAGRGFHGWAPIAYLFIFPDSDKTATISAYEVHWKD
jgi:hypothetical protein